MSTRGTNFLYQWISAICPRRSAQISSRVTVTPLGGEHEDLWGGLERRMSSPLNFDGTGGFEKGKTGSDENCRRGGSLGG